MKPVDLGPCGEEVEGGGVPGGRTANKGTEAGAHVEYLGIVTCKGMQSSRPETVGCTGKAPSVPVKCRFPGPQLRGSDLVGLGGSQDSTYLAPYEATEHILRRTAASTGIACEAKDMASPVEDVLKDLH